MSQKIIRVATIPGSLISLLRGQLKFISEHFDVLGVASKGDNNEMDLLAKNEGIRTEPVEMSRKITPIKDLIALWRLYKLFIREAPFIVHSHTPKAGTLSMIAAKLARVPNRLHTVAGLPLLEAKGIKRVVLNFVEKITYSCATKVYPNSFGLQEIILKHRFAKKNKVKVLANGSSNGIDTSYFNPEHYSYSSKELLKSTLGITHNDFVFIYVGRLVKDKGVNELIEAFNNLNNNNKQVKLLLVGDFEKELDPLLPKTIDIIKKNSNILETGWVIDVRPYFSIANALTFPSYREGFPNVVMQAGAMQLPSIVTNINGCNEIISHNENGIIIPVKDTLALYDAMVYILNHKEKSKKMGISSRYLIESNYKQEFVWNAIMEEYKIVLNENILQNS